MVICKKPRKHSFNALQVKLPILFSRGPDETQQSSYHLQVGVSEHLQGTVVLVFAGLLVKISLLLKFWQGQDDIKIFCFTFFSDELQCTYKMHVTGTLPLSYKPSLELLPLQTMQSLENDLKRKTAIFTYTYLLRAHVLCYNCVSLGFVRK